MKVIDKASWQIDGGIRHTDVVAHFRKIFTWLATKGLLTAEGKEIMEIGIDESVSLHERLVTSEALSFLEATYDDYVKSYPYGTDEDSSALEKSYAAFQQPVK